MNKDVLFKAASDYNCTPGLHGCEGFSINGASEVFTLNGTHMRALRSDCETNVVMISTPLLEEYLMAAMSSCHLLI